MMNYFKKISLLTIACGMIIGFLPTGYAAEEQPAAAPIQVLPPQGAVQKLKVYKYLLNEQGIDIIEEGETRTVVIPSDPLFVDHSANFKNEYVDNLKIVAELLKNYDVTQIAITAYTSQAGESARALTDKQAQKVMKYLQKRGVDTRLIYAQGYGNSYPVAVGANNQNFNRRIEIKFQFYPNQTQESL